MTAKAPTMPAGREIGVLGNVGRDIGTDLDADVLDTGTPYGETCGLRACRTGNGDLLLWGWFDGIVSTPPPSEHPTDLLRRLLQNT